MRKNKKLIDAFRQEVEGIRGYVVAARVPTVIQKWIGHGKVTNTAVWELLNLLGVGHDDDEVDFLTVSKLATIVQATFDESGRGADKKKKNAYRDMSSVKKTITYNSMGEKGTTFTTIGPVHAGSVSRVNVSGSCEKLRHLWRSTAPRVRVFCY